MLFISFKVTKITLQEELGSIQPVWIISFAPVIENPNELGISQEVNLYLYGQGAGASYRTGDVYEFRIKKLE